MKLKNYTWDRVLFNAIGYPLVILFALACLLPFIMVVSSSFTSEDYILANGYTLFPVEFSVEGYKTALKNPAEILRAYGLTMFVTATGTFISVFINVMTGYCLQKKDFPYRNVFSFFFFFTTLFSGGLVPWYIMCIKYLNFKNHIYALILPSLVSVWNILLAKGYIGGIPFEISESAKIDGASDLRIFLQIIIPLSKPIIATLALFTALNYWNDWYNCMLFISDEKLHTLQYFLYKLQNSLVAWRNLITHGGGAGAVTFDFPEESMKMAMTIIVTGPIVMLYPFVQKYFIKGLVVGSVKG